MKPGPPSPPINTFSRHTRARYGEPVGKVMLATGLPCPNRAKGGCIYCAAESFTPFYLDHGDGIAAQLDKGKRLMLGKRYRRYYAYFQQETTTALPADTLLPMLRIPMADPDCVGLIVSTRPDCLEDAFLQGFSGLRGRHPDREFLLELGLQTAHDRTLSAINRNHTFADFERAVARIRQAPGITLGAHVILGLPGEGLPEMLATVGELVRVGMDYVKFHHLQVVRGTRLAELHAERPVRLFDAAEYMTVLAQILAILPRRVVVHRLWAMAGPDQLIAPRWNKYANELNTMLAAEMAARGLFQGKHAEGA